MVVGMYGWFKRGSVVGSEWAHLGMDGFRCVRMGLVKQCYEGRHVHGVRPRGAMVGSGEGAGCVRATTGVVGRCRNTGGRVGTGETKLNEGRGTIN